MYENIQTAIRYTQIHKNVCLKYYRCKYLIHFLNSGTSVHLILDKIQPGAVQT